jgi:flagellar biosynthesis/type III secretory pathway protein FliH
MESNEGKRKRIKNNFRSLAVFIAIIALIYIVLQKWDKAETETYNKIHDEAYDEGYGEGYEAGYEAGQRAIIDNPWDYELFRESDTMTTEEILDEFAEEYGYYKAN